MSWRHHTPSINWWPLSFKGRTLVELPHKLPFSRKGSKSALWLCHMTAPVNEILLHFLEIALKLLLDIFNEIVRKGTVPDSRLEGFIINPITKPDIDKSLAIYFYERRCFSLAVLGENVLQFVKWVRVFCLIYNSRFICNSWTTKVFDILQAFSYQLWRSDCTMLSRFYIAYWTTDVKHIWQHQLILGIVIVILLIPRVLDAYKNLEFLTQ